MSEQVKHRLCGGWKHLFFVSSFLGIALAVTQIFNFGLVLMDKCYYYALIMFYFSFVFIIVPSGPKAPRDRVPWYDIIGFALSLGCALYMAINATRMITEGWEFIAPPVPTATSIIFWLIIIEAARRTGGLALTLIVTFFSLYPIFAHHMPWFLEGQGYSILLTARYHIMSNEGILGIPMAVFGSLIIGFIIFGVALKETGGGDFFLDISSALLGHKRGGPAKVAIISSAFFGSLSGSVISNVLTTGSMTIPSMKKAGYPPEFAGAIEACASTGGVLMPPIMGATAFIMATFLGMSYAHVCISAAIPSFLYYFGLFIQVDAYAAKSNLLGVARDDLPPLRKTLVNGWYYIATFAVLFYFLFFLRREAQAPLIASAFLIVMAAIKTKNRFGFKAFHKFILSVGTLLSELIGILAAIGFILGSLAVTGVANAFSRELVALAGGSVPILLLMGAMASFILGMGMTVTACYVFLAIVLGPALVKAGLNPVAVHLFIMYWGMISFITPPVAIAAYAAAPLAESDPFKIGFKALKLGIIIFIIPFFFVMEPALVFQAPIKEVLISVTTATIGVFVLGGALEGYMMGVGLLTKFYRVILLLGGLLMIIPDWRTDSIGFALIAMTLFRKRFTNAPAVSMAETE